MLHERKNEVFQELFDSCLNLQYGKAKDYATNSDALSNFKSQDAEALGLTPYQKWGVYFGKQAMSILGAIGKNPKFPSTTSEPIEERINDAIIYLVLFKCLLEDMNNTSENTDGVSIKPKMTNEYKKVVIEKGENGFILRFSEKLDKFERSPYSHFYVFNENNPYVQYKCMPLQTITADVYECSIFEKRVWGNINWLIEPITEDIEIKVEDTWFMTM